MSSIQERLQLKRVPLDTWNIKEQLCLASAVVRSGDQNWMSVSRALKTVGETNRPPDWYSQKSCAAQYGALLEHVETPKRKKRSSEGAVETPQESILKRLTQERIVEIQKTLAEMNQQYDLLKTEIAEVRNPSTSEDRMKDLWASIEAAKRARERENARRAAWLKEREERRARADRTWKPAQPTTPTSPATPVPPSSPLLTSLLKSSPVVTTPQHITHPANVVETISPSATAPTLSMLLEKSAPSGATQHESKHAAIEHIKSQLVQIEQQLIASTAASPVPPAPLPAAPSVDIDDIEIKAEDVYAFRDVDIHIPPVATMHKAPNRVIEKPTFKKDDSAIPTAVIEEPPVTTADTIKEEPMAVESLQESVELQQQQQQQQHHQHQHQQQPTQTEMGPEVQPDVVPDVVEVPLPPPPPEPEPEVKISFPEVKFPTPEIKVIQPDEHKNATLALSNLRAFTPHTTDTTDRDGDTMKTGVQTTRPRRSSTYSYLIKEEVKEPEIPVPEPEPEVEVVEDEAPVEVVPEESTEKQEVPVEAIPEPPPLVVLEETLPEEEEKSPPLPPEAIPLPPEPEIKAEEVVEEPVAEEPTLPLEPEVPPQEPLSEVKEEPQEPLPLEEPSVEDVVEDVKKDEDAEDSLPLKDMLKEKSAVQEMLKPLLKPEEDSHTETDDDTPMELSREEEKDGKKKRDYSRKKKSNSRTCSGSESAPDSPSSNDADRRHRLWKKSVMLVYSRLCAHKYASLFVRPISDEEAPGYSTVVKRPMDLTAIRRNIDSGVIRSTAAFQRDVLLMLSNALMYNSSEHSVYTMAREMHEEAQCQLGMLLAAQAHAGLTEPPPRRKRRRPDSPTHATTSKRH